MLLSKLRNTALLFSLLGLAGCSFQPLYGDNGALAQTQTIAKDVGVEVTGKDPRVAQALDNELSYLLGSDQGQQLYTLNVKYSILASALFSSTVDRVSSYSMQMGGEWQLINKATAEVITSGLSNTAVSYTRTDQPFANIRAERDAEDRATKLLSKDISTQLTAWIASNPTRMIAQ
jgi:LPS-assembly lipoprotein